MFNVSMVVDTPDVYYSGLIEVSIKYSVTYDGITGTNNHIYISESIHTLSNPIPDATITVINPSVTVVNIGDGSYELDLQAGQTITILLPHNILIWLSI